MRKWFAVFVAAVLWVVLLPAFGCGKSEIVATRYEITRGTG